MIFCARATRGRRIPSPGLMARLGVPVGGRVIKLRALEDQSTPIPEEITSELGWIICSLVRRPLVDQHGCPSKRGNARPCDPSDSQALAHCKVILDRYAELAQDGSVIENFGNKVLARFFEDDDRRKLPASQIDKIARILARLNEAITVRDMGLPGYRLHPLKGELAGFWSVTVSGNWRIIFRFENGSAFDVDLIDYH